MAIFFNVKQAREHLLKHGHVYTLRSNTPARIHVAAGPTTDRARWGGFYKFQDLGPVKVEFVKKMRNPMELEPYVAESGFLTTMAWLQFAERGQDILLKVTRLGTQAQETDFWKSAAGKKPLSLKEIEAKGYDVIEMFRYARLDLKRMSVNMAIEDVGKHFNVPWEIAWTIVQEAFRYPMRKGPTTRAGLQRVATKLDLEGVKELKEQDLESLLNNPYVVLTQPAKDYLMRKFRRQAREMDLKLSPSGTSKKKRRE